MKWGKDLENTTNDFFFPKCITIATYWSEYIIQIILFILTKLCGGW